MYAIRYVRPAISQFRRLLLSAVARELAEENFLARKIFLALVAVGDGLIIQRFVIISLRSLRLEPSTELTVAEFVGRN